MASETATLPARGPESAHSGERYLTNVVWSWVGFGINLLTGFLVSPYVIRKLGAEGYGVWALLFSIIGYYGILDLGIRSALVRYSALFHTRGEFDKLNELVSTVIAYYTAGSLLLFGVTLVVSRNVDRIFHVSSIYRGDFAALIVLTGACWVLGTSVFPACLEGLQRFDISSRVYIVTLSIRGVGTCLLLFFGYGLLALGLNVMLAQIIGVLLSYRGFRRVFPQLRLSLALAKFTMLKELASYAVHTFVANVASQLLGQSPALLIGIFKPAAFIGYFSFPQRLMQYSADFVWRVGSVSASAAAEMDAKERLDRVARLAAYANRYSLALFMPVALFILLYGKELIRVWVGAEFASYCAPLLPILVAGTVLADVSQFNSSAVLFGIGSHQRYARALMVEAVLNITGVCLLTPRFGISGAAWAVVIPKIVMRGLYAPWLITRRVGASYPTYMADILVKPFIAAPLALVFLYTAKSHFLAGQNWTELLLAGTGAAVTYWGVAFGATLEPGHRQMIIGWLRPSLRRAPPN